MHETGVAEYGDIFEGSNVVEKLTDEIAGRARAIALKLRDAGYSRAIATVGSGADATARRASTQTRKRRTGAGRC